MIKKLLLFTSVLAGSLSAFAQSSSLGGLDIPDDVLERLKEKADSANKADKGFTLDTSSRVIDPSLIDPSLITRPTITTPTTREGKIAEYIKGCGYKPADLSVSNYKFSESFPQVFVDENGYKWERYGTTKGKVPSTVYLTRQSNVYPGALFFYNFSEMVNSTSQDLQVCGVARNNITLSTNLLNTTSGSVSPTQSAVGQYVQQAYKQWASSGASTSSMIQVEVHEVKSSEVLKATAGVSAGACGASLKMDFSTESFCEKNYFFIRLYQTYFSVNVDALPGGDKVADNFPSSVTVDNLKSMNTGGLPIAYVNQVDYGRVVYGVISTSKSSKSTAASLEASYKSYFSANASYKDSSAVSESSLSAFYWGDDTNTLVESGGVTSLEALKAAVNKGLKLPANMNPMPVSYKVKFLYNGEDAGAVGDYQEYGERLLESTKPNLLLTYAQGFDKGWSKWEFFWGKNHGWTQTEWISTYAPKKASVLLDDYGIHYDNYGAKSDKEEGWLSSKNGDKTFSLGNEAEVLYIQCRWKRADGAKWNPYYFGPIDVRKIVSIKVYLKPTTNNDWSKGIELKELGRTVVKTDIDEIASEDRIMKLVPNPASNMVSIVADEEVSDVEVMNMLGEVVLRTNSSQINISELNSGMYIVKAVVGTTLVIDKLVVKK